MSYFHLKIETTSKKHIYKYDKTREEMIDEYVTKYLSKKPFFVDGYKLDFDNVSQFKIVETKKNIKETLYDIKQSYYRNGVIAAFDESYIVDNHNYSREVTQSFFDESGDLNEKTVENDSEKKHIFVVHGRDRSKVEEVENFIRSIGYEPIVLFKEADSGLTIIEKIEKYSNVSCFGIVIYTECDMGYLIDHPDEAKPRARQNVVFEHGYLMAKLGRKNVCALVESPHIEMPSDISGIIYKNYDVNGLWKYSIAKDMAESGIKVDLNKIR